MEERGTSGENDTPAIVAAVRDGNLGLVMQLAQQGHSLHDRDKDGATALYWACSRGHTHISDFLLNAGSDVNARVKWGATPLLAAADNGQEICTSQLLGKHADVNEANDRGDTPLHAAAYRGYLRILCMLMEAGANPFLKNSTSMTPLQEAFVQRHLECVERLRQYMDVPGLSGPISLPNTSQENTSSSYTDNPGESYKTWPYVPSQSRPRLAQTGQQTQNNSLPSPKMNTTNKTETHSLNLYHRSRPLFENGNSDLPKPTTLNVREHNKGLVDSLSSLRKSHYRNLDDIRDSSISELTAKSNGDILSFDSLLLNAVSIPSKPGGQVLYNGRNSRPNSLSNDDNQELNYETPRTENVHNLKQYKQNNEIQTAPILAPQGRTSKRHNLTDSITQVVTSNSRSRSETSNTRSLSDLNQICVPEKRSGKAKHVLSKLIPGVSVSEFVERLQLQVIELQEKVTQSNAIIANLRDQLISVDRENKGLKTDNLILRSLLHQRELSFDIITSGAPDSSGSGQYTTSSPELLQSVAPLVETSGSESHVVCRQPMESSECEDSPP